MFETASASVLAGVQVPRDSFRAFNSRRIFEKMEGLAQSRNYSNTSHLIFRDLVENYLSYNKHSSSQFSLSVLSESRSIYGTDSSQMYSRLLSIFVMNKIISGQAIH